MQSPEKNMRLKVGREKEEVEGLECLCDTESERETDGEQEKETERVEPVCSFHLLISFPGGIYHRLQRRRQVEKRKRKIVKFVPAAIFSHHKSEPHTCKEFFCFSSLIDASK